jgi:hypothetical protein
MRNLSFSRTFLPGNIGLYGSCHFDSQLKTWFQWLSTDIERIRRAADGKMQEWYSEDNPQCSDTHASRLPRFLLRLNIDMEGVNN